MRSIPRTRDAAMSAVPATAKQEGEQLLGHLPDDSTLKDIQYHLYLLEKIERGQADVEADWTLTHEQARERMQRWPQG